MILDGPRSVGITPQAGNQLHAAEGGCWRGCWVSRSLTIDGS